MTPSVLPLGPGLTADRVKTSSLLQNAYPAFYLVITGAIRLEVKRPGLEANHCSMSTNDVARAVPDGSRMLSWLHRECLIEINRQCCCYK